MRYRRLDANGDYTFGQGSANFLIDTPECVGQSVLTRLLLWRGEWFLDVTSGMPWATAVLGKNTLPLYDSAIRARVLDTAGVTSIVSYTSSLDTEQRALTVSMTINTQFGQAPPLNVVL